MTLATNVVKRPGSQHFYARLKVPTDLIEVVGKRDLWKSLRTTDPRQARVASAAVLHRWQSDFDDLRRRRAPAPNDLTRAAWSHYTGELDRDARDRLALPSTAAIEEHRRGALNALAALPESERGGIAGVGAALDYLAARGAADLQRETREARAATIRDHLRTGETALIEWAADLFVSRERLILAKGSPDYRALCQTLQRAELEALERGRERDAGVWAGEPKDPAVRPPEPETTAKVAAPGETILELFALFKREKFASAKPDTWNTNGKVIALFADFLGPAAHVSIIERKAVRDFKQHLLRYPLRAADTKAFAGLGFREAIEANVTAKKPTLAAKTINRYLSAVGAFSEWLFQNDYLPGQPMAGQYLAVDKSKRPVRSHTPEELQAIFASPLFAGCAGPGREHVPGDVRVRDWRYWLPLVALYSGARLGELVQLLVADVREDRGVPILHVTDEGDGGKNVKTRGSARVVPVHPELVRLGFLEHVESMRAKGEARVFPETGRDTRGQFGEASRWFGRYFERIGVKKDAKVNFHSFRHGVADAFRRAGYLDEQFAPLLGHVKASTTGRYGILPQGVLSDRKAMIDAVSYPGLSVRASDVAER